MSKSHKAMSDGVWAERMRSFARNGRWLQSAGVRPSTANKRWFKVYNNIESCPMQKLRGGLQSILQFTGKAGGANSNKCVCGYHNVKNMGSSSAVVPKTVEQEQQVKDKETNITSPLVVEPHRKTFPSYLEEKKGATSGRKESSRHVMPQVVNPYPLKKAGSQKMSPLMRNSLELYKQKQKPRQNVPCTVTTSSVSTEGSSEGISPNPLAESSLTPWEMTSRSIQDMSPVSSDVSTVTSHIDALGSTPQSVATTFPLTVEGPVTTTVCSTVTASISTTPTVVTPVASQSTVTPSPSLIPDSPAGRPVATTASTERPLLPNSWYKSLPVSDQKWVSNALFVSDAKGRAKLKPDLKLWWHPPQTGLIPSSPPAPGLYFSRPLLLWMPYTLWSYKFTCPRPGCKKQLTRCGTYRTVRQILDIDGYYHLATELLSCTTCDKRVVGWSKSILDQMDIAHRSLFSAILTYRYGADMRVIRLFRERTLGNGPFRLAKQLQEQHSEAWLLKTMKYLSDCRGFLQSPFTTCSFENPPSPAVTPTYNWLLTVYLQDILSRLDSVKSHITSVYGRILKMDSTKKIVKKLKGKSAGTAAWVTDVGNENGEVLICILTASEGVGLKPMTQGIVKRYKCAKEPQPDVIYVDRDCCVAHSRGSSLEDLYHPWSSPIRLDIWHFMRRFSGGVNTEAHPLYRVFLQKLSACIFEWDAEDVGELREAKRNQLQQSGRVHLTDAAVDRAISSQELSMHCRRRTRGVEATTSRIESLLCTLDGPAGRDVMGFPLFNKDKIWAIWQTQKHHVPCIQDVPDVKLYTQVGTSMKGGKRLQVLRCGRGSTSLESFHHHLKQFIPGDNASDLHFQAYLLEGLFRWNQDRAANRMKEAQMHRCYDARIKQAVNDLSVAVLGHKLYPDFLPPGQYTGELIGVEYLFRQTGQALEEIILDPETMQPEINIPEGEEPVDEGFEEEDLTVASLTEEIMVLTPQKEVSLDDVVAEETDLVIDEPFYGDREQNVKEKQSSTSGATVGPNCIEGYEKVQALATFLVGLKNQSCLDNDSVRHIIFLWQSLDAYDKKRVDYPERHRESLTQGRFKTTRTKTSTVASGLESTKRSFIGPGVAAQWPDASRLVEAICVILCSAYSTLRKGKWSAILKDYRAIQELVMGNGFLIQATAIALYDLNQYTLSQWYTKRQKANEEKLLLQGSGLPSGMPIAAEPLPPAKQLPTEPPIRQHTPMVIYLPPNLAGQAVRAQPPQNTQPPPFQPPSFIGAPPPSGFAVGTPLNTMTQPQSVQPHPVVVASPPSGYVVPYSTFYKRRKEADKERTKRPYNRKTTFNKCRRCGDFLIAQTGHSQVKPKTGGRRYFCPAVDGKDGTTVDEWKRQQQTDEPH